MNATKALKISRPWGVSSIRSLLGRHAVIDRPFQLKYTGYLIGLTLIISILVAALNLYFLNENYRVFLDLAVTHFPKMLAHLEREWVFMNALILGSVFGAVLFCFLFGIRYTGRLVAPLVILRDHLKSSSRGMWYRPEVRVRSTDEFHDLVDAYNYFYKAIRLQTRNDLRRLEQIKKQAKDEGSIRLIEQMIEEKQMQLSETKAAAPL